MKPRSVPVYSPGFEAWWAIYPRKVAKVRAYQEWVAWGCETITGVLPALRLQLPTFCQRSIEHVPHPSTYLHQRRWEDEIVQPSANGAATRDARPLALYCNGHLDRQGRWSEDPRPDCPACKHLRAKYPTHPRSVSMDDLFRKEGA